MKQLKATLEGTADGALILDADNKVVFWNSAAERLLGFRAEEVVGRPCHEVMRGKSLTGHPLCSTPCSIACRLASGRSVRNFDMQTLTKTGRMIWLNVSSIPVPTRKKGRYTVAHLFRDVTKQAKVRRLVEDLHAVLCGGRETPADPLIAKEPAPEISVALHLSERELEVLRLLAAGEDTKVIADRLCISPATVRNHTQHILEKLGAHSRLQALAIAFRPGATPAGL
jgi:PAS domain S-box-containing protein